MSRAKLMVMSDAPTSTSGLGRITRDLVSRIHEHLSDTIEVATFGYGGNVSRHLPWQQYPCTRLDNWVAPELPYCWRDFAGDEPGYLLAVWNPGWIPWLADPEILPPSELRSFLKTNPFQKWIYAPVDGEGFGGKLPPGIKGVLNGFDRVLHYSEYSAKMDGSEHWLPHGIDDTVFFRRDREAIRKSFIETVSGRQARPIDPSVTIVGIVATNSIRKDWGLGLETCAVLKQRGMNIGVWAHTDSFTKHWDLVEMANSFGLASRVIFTNGSLDDNTMAEAYSGCDITLGIGAGEGFGYPLAESLACGTPVIHGNYAGGADYVPLQFLVGPRGFKWDGGPYSYRRPTFTAEQWADSVEYAVERTKAGIPVQLPSEYYWKNLWPRWQKWIEEGING